MLNDDEIKYEDIVGCADCNSNIRDDGPSNRKFIPTFKGGERLVMLSGKTSISGVILPAFDHTMSRADEDYKYGYLPYRDVSRPDPEKNNIPKFNMWAYVFKIYSFFGKSFSTFLSPLKWKKEDPIISLRKLIHSKYKGNAEYMVLVEGDKKAGDWKAQKAYLQNPTVMYLLNAYCPPTYSKDGNREPGNHILGLKTTAFDHLVQDLDKPRPASLAQPRDPNWPAFLFGDITDPNNAVMFNTVTRMVETGNGNKNNTTLLNLGDCTYDGKFNYTPGNVTREMLAGRFDIPAEIYIPSPQEIVDVIVEDGVVPLELIREACSGYAAVDSPADVASSAPVSAQYTAPAAPAAPPAPPAPAAPSAPMPPAPAQQPPVYAYVNGAVSQMSIDTIIALGDPNTQVNVNGAWVAASTQPWWPAAPAAPAAPPAPPAAPAAPSAPVDEPEDAIDMSPDYGARTKEEEELFTQLRTRMTQPGQAALRNDELQQFKQLMNKRPYKG